MDLLGRKGGVGGADPGADEQDADCDDPDPEAKYGSQASLVQANQASTRPAPAIAHQPSPRQHPRRDKHQPVAIAKLPMATQILAKPRLPTSKAYAARPGSMSAARLLAAFQLASSTPYAGSSTPETPATTDRQGGLPSARPRSRHWAYDRPDQDEGGQGHCVSETHQPASPALTKKACACSAVASRTAARPASRRR